MRTSPLIRSLRQLVRKHPGLTIVPKAEGCFYMPKIFLSSQHDYVFDLDDSGFNDLCLEVENRKCFNQFGHFDFEELAKHYGRVPKCPKCGNNKPYKDGKDINGYQRYRCKCGCRFNLLTNSVISSVKTTLPQWFSMIRLMSFNVPIDLIAEQINVHHNTALLMRRKLFETVNNWQNKTKLSGVVFIDEIYTFDSERPKNHFGKNKRGLTKDKCCIFLAIDQYKQMIMFFIGRGRPTSKQIKDALLPHLAEGAVTKIIHDGLFSHAKAIKKAGVEDEIHKSIVKDEETLRAMLLINSFCAWVQRYLSRFVGMDTEYLQDYLNWFVYLFRCKQQDEKWPRDERILRHILLTDVELKRSDLEEKREKVRKVIKHKRGWKPKKKKTLYDK